jgi:hypothetical protein
MSMNVRLTTGLLGLALLLGCSAASAREQKTEPYPTLGLVHRDESSPVLKELWVLGRYHGQYHWSEGNSGDDHGWEDRRFRLGAQARLFERLTLHAQAVSGSDLEPLYNGFTELWAGWRFSDAVTLTVGQQKHRFTHDRNVSSRYINYLERGMLTNMFGLDYTPAVTLSGNTNKDWTYYTGVFSNATGRNMGRAFTDLDSGYSFLASATRDLHGAFGTDTAHLNLAYLHSDVKGEPTNLNRFEDGLNIGVILTDGSRALVTELTAGIGGPGGDAIGLNIQPSMFLSRKVQLVGRYQIAIGETGQSLRAQRRYERPAGLDRGKRYQAGYVGADYYVAAHRLKLMVGLEYARLDNRDVWTTSVAVRSFFGPHSRAPFPAALLLEPD